LLRNKKEGIAQKGANPKSPKEIKFKKGPFFKKKFVPKIRPVLKGFG